MRREVGRSRSELAWALRAIRELMRPRCARVPIEHLPITLKMGQLDYCRLLAASRTAEVGVLSWAFDPASSINVALGSFC